MDWGMKSWEEYVGWKTREKLFMRCCCSEKTRCFHLQVSYVMVIQFGWYVRRKSVGKYNISELNIYNKIENNNNTESKNKFQNMKTTPAAFRSRKNNKIHDTFITPLLFDALPHITHHSLNSHSLSITFSLFIYISTPCLTSYTTTLFKKKKIYIFPTSSSSSPYF